MIDPLQGQVLFYPVLMVPGRSGNGRNRPGPFKWGPPCDTPRQARAIVDASLSAREATLGFVVRFPERQGDIQVLVSYICPTSARKAVQHYVDLCNLIDAEHD